MPEIIYTIIKYLLIIMSITLLTSEVFLMSKKLFLVSGNICGTRIKLGRAQQNPPITQDELSRKINLMGYRIMPLIISRIETNQRHVCDAELLIFSQALNVSMEWLCSEKINT